MKKLLWIVVIVCVLLGGYWILKIQLSQGQLANDISWQETHDDFILHMRVEKTDSGFQVLKSLQYIGNDNVEIKHRTPIVSISFNKNKQIFTGNTVTKELTNGERYHPYYPKKFPTKDKGTYSLYYLASFNVDGEDVHFSGKKDIVFD